MAARQSGAFVATHLVIPSDLTAAREVEKRVSDQVARYSYDEAARFAIKLAVEEGLNNAIKHGNRFDPTKMVEVQYEINENRVSVTITDEGPGFDPADVPDPTADENLEKPCGRGIMLMRAYMDEVRYNDIGNQVYFVKHNSS